ALWAITYGDLMSYLMIFFMVLFAFYSSKNINAQFSAKSIEETFGRDNSVVSTLFSKSGIQQIAQVEISASRININFSEPILFDPGSDRLKKSSLPHLRRLGAIFRDLPNPIQIAGHTDNRPLGRYVRFKSNWELSAARAFSVLQFFVKEGVAPEKLSAVGYGEFKPVSANDTPQGRAANRRIAIHIVRHEI
ncbi:MAG: hypothetical protein COT18_11925, partial [Elusimicrobia bacterium CG08_land_8_20_14_0_20_59_10]